MNVADFHFIGTDENTVNQLDDGSLDFTAHEVFIRSLDNLHVVHSALDKGVELVHIYHLSDRHFTFEPSIVHTVKGIIVASDVRLSSSKPPALIILHDGVFDGGLGSDHRLHVITGHELDIVEGEHVGGIGHGQGQRTPGAAYGNQLILFGCFGRDKLDDTRVYLEIHQVDRWDPVLFAEERDDLRLFQDVQLGQVVPQPAP